MNLILTIKNTIINMKSILYLLALAPTVYSYSGNCIPSCTISTYGTDWNFAYVRPNPCNNRQPYTTLYDGNTVYNLGVTQYGCGYQYTQVLFGNNKVGWVGSQFLDCNGPYPPAPAAALAPAVEPVPSYTGSDGGSGSN